MYILFKRHGNKRFFKRYNTFEELEAEISRGHNESFPGNKQFYFDTQAREITILNNRLSKLACEEYLASANVGYALESA
jgi:hypothetical protein